MSLTPCPPPPLSHQVFPGEKATLGKFWVRLKIALQVEFSRQPSDRSKYDHLGENEDLKKFFMFCIPWWLPFSLCCDYWSSGLLWMWRRKDLNWVNWNDTKSTILTQIHPLSWIISPQIAGSIGLISRVLKKLILMIFSSFLIAFMENIIFRSFYSIILWMPPKLIKF